jgi:cholesterol transport system auxiliary component
MKKFVQISFGLCIMLLLPSLMSSCATVRQPSLRIQHYTLEYTPPDVTEHPPLPAILKVERFSAAPFYSTQQMIYRDRSFKREAYTYHRWRAYPGDLVSDFLARDARHSGLFRAVVQEGSTVSSTHILEGSLDEFFEWNEEEGWKAVLTVTATLLTAKEVDMDKRVLFQKTFRALEPMREKTPKGLAEAMSEAMSAVSEEILQTVYERLSVTNGK